MYIPTYVVCVLQFIYALVHCILSIGSFPADIQEFYVHTLDGSLPESQKTSETRNYANKWEKHAPVPAGQVPSTTTTVSTGIAPPPAKAAFQEVSHQ